MRSLMAVAAVLCALSRSLGAQEPAQIQQFSIPGHGSLMLRVPAGWKVLSKSLEKPPSVVLRFAPASGDGFNLQVTSVWLDAEKIATFTPDKIKSAVQGAAARLLADAAEKDAALVELRGAQSIGYHASLTQGGTPSDANDYKYVTQGTLRTGEVMTLFTFLYRDPVLPEREQALRMFADASYSATGLTAATAPRSDILQVRELAQSYELSVPASRLVVTLPKGSLFRATNQRGGSADNPRYFFFEDPANHIFVSGWMESERGFSGIKAFWENETTAMGRRGLPAPQDVLFTRIGNWEAILYDQPIPIGTNSHIRAHWLQAGTWIDMHISIAFDGSSAESRAKVMALLKTIQVKERK
jgi:hypothetical protein